MRDFRIQSGRENSEVPVTINPGSTEQVVDNGKSNAGKSNNSKSASPINDALFLHFKKWRPELLEDNT